MFYGRHAKPIVVGIILAAVAGWVLFLLVSQLAGASLLVGTGFALLPFLPAGSPPPYDGAGGADPQGTLGTSEADLGSGPYLGGDT